MRTRSTGAPKPVPEKKTPPAKKAKATTESSPSSVTPRPRGRPPKNIAKTPPIDSEEQGSPVTQQETPKTTSSSKPATRKAPARTNKTPPSANPGSKRTSSSEKVAAVKAGKSLNKEEVVDMEAVEFGKEDEHAAEKVVSENEEGDEVTIKDALDTAGGESTANDGNFAELEQELAVDMVQLLVEEKTVIESQEHSPTDVAKQGEYVTEDKEFVMDVVETLMEQKPVIEAENFSMTDVLEQKSMAREDEVSASKGANTTEIEKNLGMKAVESLNDEKLIIEAQGSLVTNVTVQAQPVIQHWETPLVICGRSEKLKEHIDEGVLENSKTDGESERAIVMPENNKTKISDVGEHPDKDHAVEVQRELQQEGGEGIIDVPKEIFLELSNMEEYETKDQSEEMQEETVAGGDSITVEATDDNKTEPSNMDEDSIDKIEKGQDELNADDVKREINVTEQGKMVPSVLKDDPNENMRVNDMNLEGSGNKGEMMDGYEHNNEDSTEEAKTLEEEHVELTAIVQKRKLKRENEIFVGGLDRDTFEEDLRHVFEKMGEIVEVRMHKSCSRTENNGYAFVMFANKEQAMRTLSEMKNPVICGNQCETAASEDNNSLFLGNICNTWTKEDILNKLKDYGLEGIQNITLVPDAHREGLSRGFAFIEFSCHAAAMVAYKRLQKPDAIFGHHERTVKVAFAEPLPEPNSDIMAQVKAVFVDGIFPHWDETLVRQYFKGYGEIEKIVLARNMSTAKRKDFGFVHFSTHEAAVACIESMNNTELVDGNTKTRVRVRLSNPLPKTPTVKGGMLGGFHIGDAGGGSFPKYGKGNGSAGHIFNQGNLQPVHHGRHQLGGIGFPGEPAINNRYPESHTRQGFERGGRGLIRAGYHASGSSAVSTGQSRPFSDRPRNNSIDVGHGSNDLLRRQAFPPEGFERPFYGSQSEDLYRYDNSVQGMKRPFHTDPGYMESSRLRPRLGYPNGPALYPESQHHDVAAGSNVYPPDSYGSISNYGRGEPSPFYGGDHLNGVGYGVSRPDDSRGGAAGSLDRGYGGSRPFGRGFTGARPHGGGVGGDKRHGSGYY